MPKSGSETAGFPTAPVPTLAVGVTGHRASHPSFPSDTAELEQVVERLCSHIEQAARQAEIFGLSDPQRAFRLVTLLSDGADQIAANTALKMRWELAAPLPFGRQLNIAINAEPETLSDASALLAGQRPDDPVVATRAAAIADLTERANVIELADEDGPSRAALLASLQTPDDSRVVANFVQLCSKRVVYAGRILIEQSDILIAVWDGQGTTNTGGTGHTARLALEAGVPVIWINPLHPEKWTIIRTPEALIDPDPHGADLEQLGALISDAIGLQAPQTDEMHSGLSALAPDSWRPKSGRLGLPYRRVEALFGEKSWGRKLASVDQVFESPQDYAEGTGAALVEDMAALSQHGAAALANISRETLPRFALANGIAARLSNLYRSGMVINFALGALAIIAGVLYLPLVDVSQKWIFAAIELALLLAILANTFAGQRMRLHGRWMETRRAAEYLRHSPILLALGIDRTVGAWPQGLRSAWPEWYAQRVSRQIGVPQLRIDQAYLRKCAAILRDHFIEPQRDYHIVKADKLHRAHHAVERLAESMFVIAIAAVVLYLAAVAGSASGGIDPQIVNKSAKWFTVIAVALPTMSGALAAIGYFSDFDRFADVSSMTVQKLDALAQRLETFLALPDERLSYAQLADLARLMDQTTLEEIQAWQAVFSGKRTTVPA